MSTATPLPEQRPPKPWLAGLGVVTAVLAVTAAFAWPYLEAERPAERELDTYWPMNRPWGMQVTLDPAGQPTEWTGYALEEVPGVQALTALDGAGVSALMELGVKDATTAKAARVFRASARALKPDGTARDLMYYSARTSTGHYYFADRDLNTTTTYVYRPPMRVLPARVQPGERWTQTGKINDRVDYSVDGRIEQAGPADTEGRQDCVRVTRTMTISNAGTPLNASTTVEHYCPGVGYVGGETRDSQGVRRTVEYGVSGTRAEWLPPAAPAPTARTGEKPPAQGELTLIGRVTPSNRDRVSAPPAVLLTSGGMLAVTTNVLDAVTAFAMNDDPGRVAWRFRPGGSVTGGVAVDEQRGRVYFGSSARRLYALDARGLPLWSVPLGDHVATPPLVAGDAVIAVTENGYATAVDATGKLLWEADLGAISIAAPTYAAGLAVFANQNGDLIGVRPQDGRTVWKANLGGPVTAPLVAAGTSVYAGTDTGEVARVEAATGRVTWQEKAGRGGAIRGAPAVTDTRVVVNAGGQLVTLGVTGGDVLASTGSDYVGAPLTHGASVYAATRTEVRRLTLDLRVLTQAEGPRDNGRFVTGPVLAGGSLLLGDVQGGVWRYGPPGSSPLRATWQVGTDATRAGFAAVAVRPVVLQGRTIFLDDEGSVHELRADGGTQSVTKLKLDGLTGRPGTDGRAMIALPDRTHVRLLDATSGRERWSSDVGGVVVQTPAFTRDAVVVVTATPEVVALDAESGRVTWRAPLTQSLVGSPITDGDTVWVSSPLMALDATTGALRWQSEASTFGSGLLDPQEKVMYVRALLGNTPTLMAVDATTGALRWRAALPQSATAVFEPLLASAGVIVVPTDGPTLVGVEHAGGRVRWTHTGSTLRWGAPATNDRHVAYAGTDGHVTVLDAASGEVAGRWRGAELTLKDNRYQLPQPVFVQDALLVPRGFDLTRLELRTPGGTP